MMFFPYASRSLGLLLILALNIQAHEEAGALEVDLAWADAQFSDSAPEGEDIPSIR